MKSKCTYVLVSSTGPHIRVSKCPPNEYQCQGTELCIHMSKLCDGVPDCTDGGDEGPHCRGDDDSYSQTYRQKDREADSHIDRERPVHTEMHIDTEIQTDIYM